MYMFFYRPFYRNKSVYSGVHAKTKIVINGCRRHSAETLLKKERDTRKM